MALMFCPEGEHEVTVAFRAVAGERFCPKHRCSLRPIESVKPRAPMRRRQSPDEARAHAHFKRVVCAERCFFSDTVDGGPRRPGHECVYPLDPHHLVEVQWMRRELVLPPEELIAVMFNPVIGAPLCRAGHRPIEARVSEFIYWDELRLECIEFCEEVDRRQGPGAPSMLARLELESPKREGIARG